MKCPFCHLTMTQFDLSTATTTSYTCLKKDCMYCKISRYLVRVKVEDQTKISEWIIIDDKFYVEIHFDQSYTLISKLQSVIISDTIKINHALQLDLSNYTDTLNKIKLLVLFS